MSEKPNVTEQLLKMYPLCTVERLNSEDQKKLLKLNNNTCDNSIRKASWIVTGGGFLGVVASKIIGHYYSKKYFGIDVVNALGGVSSLAVLVGTGIGLDFAKRHDGRKIDDDFGGMLEKDTFDLEYDPCNILEGNWNIEGLNEESSPELLEKAENTKSLLEDRATLKEDIPAIRAEIEKKRQEIFEMTSSGKPDKTKMKNALKELQGMSTERITLATMQRIINSRLPEERPTIENEGFNEAFSTLKALQDVRKEFEKTGHLDLARFGGIKL